MEDGLFFWLIIMAVAVLQGIGAKKKKAGQLGKRPPAPPPQGQGLPSSLERAPKPARPQRASLPSEGVDEGSEAETDGSSEGMIPSDVWAEILGLARGEAQRPEPEVLQPPVPEPLPEVVRTRSRPATPAPVPAPVPAPAPAPAPRPFPTSHGAEAVLHETEPDQYESRLSVPSAPESQGGESKGVRRRLFGSGSAKELRKAVILQEVLGPPLGSRKE